MKVGIFTFPKSINYGAALQATALQGTINSRGAEAFFIDHECKAVTASDKLFDFKRALDLKYTIAHILNFPTAYKRIGKFKKFQRKHMSFVADDPYLADVVVTGSDQIWNYNITGEDFDYFLDFPKNNLKKVSYAGSFGLSEIDPKYHEKLKTFFADFDAISVREERAKELIAEIAGLDSTLVLDPTLLLKKADWEKYMAPAKDKGYIYVYTVFNSSTLWDFAYKLSEKTGLPIKTVSYSVTHKYNAQCDYSAGPDDWLRYVSDADYVVTNSFHGVAFSINFGKQFFFELPPAKSGVGSRLSNITARYGLSNRELSLADMDSKIDFSETEKLLEKDRTVSIDFIDGFLK